MMNKIVCLLILLTATFSKAQNITAPKLPVDDKTKLFSYNKVKEATNVSKDELYKRALAWANSYYKNPTDVIRENNREEGKIVCKARYKIMNPPDKKGFSTDGGVVMYALNLQFKEGRYKYDLTEINLKQQSYYPIEKWMDTKSASYKPEFDFYLKQVDDMSKEIINSLDKAMKANPVTDKKDDW